MILTQKERLKQAKALANRKHPGIWASALPLPPHLIPRGKKLPPFTGSSEPSGAKRP